MSFSGGSDSKESACNEGDLGSILGWEDPLEKGMATHTSILAWRIPWTEEPGRLQSMGLQRVRHDWATFIFTSMCYMIGPCWLSVFLGGSIGEETTCNAEDGGSIPGSGRSPEGGNCNPLQHSCLENPMDRGAWWATVHRIAKSQTWLSMHMFCQVPWMCNTLYFNGSYPQLCFHKMTFPSIKDWTLTVARSNNFYIWL